MYLTIPETNIAPEKLASQKGKERKGSSSNHQFSGAKMYFFLGRVNQPLLWQIFLFSPLPGEMIQFDLRIFFHHLVLIQRKTPPKSDIDTKNDG